MAYFRHIKTTGLDGKLFLEVYICVYLSKSIELDICLSSICMSNGFHEVVKG